MIGPQHIIVACRKAQDALILSQHKPSPKMDIGGGTTIEPPMPLPASIISAKRELRDMLLDWVGLVSEGMQVVAHCDPTEASMLDWLGSGERADYLAAHEAGMDFLDELTVVTKSLESPYMPRAGKKYIGNYGGGAVFVREGQREVTLADGETHQVADLRAYNAAHMLDMEGTASDVANIIKAFFGHNITPKQIKDAQYNDKRQRRDTPLQALRKDGNAHIYRVWDVLNRLC